ncbi:MAG TPA: hypothetical protein DCP93_08250, partial [Lachnospiraceae bacterium]|nr:hypothetical protein [Lachnospiraceae bacterium]
PSACKADALPAELRFHFVALATDLLSIQWVHRFVNKFFAIFVKILYAIKTIIDDEHIFNMELQSMI